ncbi:MAG: glycosyltransferase family 2 protein [Bacteroidales bacterium]|nr:glycosyltransferase family 2 protein [Bacteroidales bacterium]
MDISVIVPVFNEDESIGELREWITRVMEANKFSYEIIMIDDGSTDASWAKIEEMRSTDSHLKGIKFRRNYGKSAALNVGFEAAQGNVVITMDADMQDSPDEIPELYRMIMEDKYDLVSGWKQKRYDPISKTVPTKLFNAVTRWFSGIKLHDFNCGLKAYRNTVVKSVEVYGDMHRYIPVLAKQAGFKKIGEKVVQHRARKYGVTKFGMDRFVNGFLDLLTVNIVLKFGKSPMHFFGLWGTFSFAIGFIILTYLSIAKLAWQQYQMTDRPLFYFGLLMIIFGSQLFLTGFISELVARSSSDRNTYIIEKKVGME